MIFNEASLAPTTWLIGSASTALVNLACGMTALAKVTNLGRSLRLPREMSEIKISGETTFYDLLVLLVRDPKTRQEASYWMGLATKSPLLAELPCHVKDRFLGCEPAIKNVYGTDSLVLCALQAAIAISLPTDKIWENDQLTVNFEELLQDGSIVQATEKVDNLAGRSQADQIIIRYNDCAFNNIRSSNFWSEREKIFPSLIFGLDVERNILEIGDNQFETILGCLKDLDTSANKWNKTTPLIWGRKVTPESHSVMSNPKLKEHRFFKNHKGKTQLYELHARYGSSGRIHLYICPDNFTVEIGYIGQHLPL
ncbi:hypothetical protein [Janthinobacterium sp. J1-1]|uniref:hypothetical protein n=1 Tax=Janthinobacterium sp. J1-1 TaxID=3065910 RepID=UPI002811B582|nr:hypothetical protein [Janthinobacterium sp. J1-1]